MLILDPTTIAEASRNGAYPIELLSIELSDSDADRNLYMNTGYASVDFDNGRGLGSQSYMPGSRVLGFTAIEETQDIKTNSITIELNGIPTNIIQKLEATGVRPIGGIVTIYQSFWDAENGIVLHTTGTNPTPAIYQKWQGIVYSFATTEENQNSGDVKINIECKNILSAILDTKSGRYTSNTSFQQFNSTDTSMEFVPSVVNFNPQFGADAANSGSSSGSNSGPITAS